MSTSALMSFTTLLSLLDTLVCRVEVLFGFLCKRDDDEEDEEGLDAFAFVLDDV